MIIEKPAEKNVLKSEDFTKVKMTVSADKAHRISQFLRNDVYTKKELAVLRELISNACDVMDLTGSKKPIEVTLPTDFEQVFRVRDFGTGLNESGVFNTFAQYFESTKDQDNIQRGAMGIGSKAGFCISDSFTVTSYFNGEKSVYSLNLESFNGGTDAYCNKIFSEETNEENGLEIEVPIREAYVKNMIAEANNLIPFLRLGNEIKTNIEIPNLELIKISDNLFLQKTSINKDRFTVLMGNVPYETPIDAVLRERVNKNESFKKALSNFKIIIKVNIGDVVVAPSRETLQLVGKTYDCLEKKIDEADKELFSYAKSILDASQDPYERRLIAKELYGYCRDLKVEDNIISPTLLPINTKGDTVTPSYWRRKAFSFYGIPITSAYFTDGKDVKRTTTHNLSFEVKEENIFVFTYKSHRIVETLEKIVAENPDKNVYGYRFENENAYNNYVKLYNLDKVSNKYIKLHKDLEDVKKTLPKTERTVTERVKSTIAVKQFNNGGSSKPKLNFNEVENNDSLDGIYFYSKGVSYAEPTFHSFESLIIKMKHIYNVSGLNIYFVPKDFVFESKNVFHWNSPEGIEKVKNAILKKLDTREFVLKGALIINGLDIRNNLSCLYEHQMKRLSSFIKIIKVSSCIDSFEYDINTALSLYNDATVKQEIEQALAVKRVKMRALEVQKNQEFIDKVNKEGKEIIQDLITFLSSDSYYANSRVAKLILDIQKISGKQLALV